MRSELDAAHQKQMDEHPAEVPPTRFRRLKKLRTGDTKEVDGVELSV